jgi:hypothetical protein
MRPSGRAETQNGKSELQIHIDYADNDKPFQFIGKIRKIHVSRVETMLRRNILSGYTAGTL